MKQSLRRVLFQASVTVTAALSVIGTGFVFAAPTAPPPGSSIPLPLTMGSTAETKNGNLTVNGTLSTGNLCLSGTCKTAWPTANVQAGTTNTTNASDVTVPSCYLVNNGNYYNPATYQSYYYYCDSPVTLNVPFGVATVSVASSSVSCTGPANVYSGYPNYNNNAYSYQIVNSSAALNGSNVVIYATCRIWSTGSYVNTPSSGVTASGSASARYVY